MDELECMRVIDGALQEVSDEAARARIATWVAAKYAGLSSLNKGESASSIEGGSSEGAVVEKDGQIPGIAKLSSAGEVQLTVRDFKARSANDAAGRLVHVLLWATKKLTGNLSVSSKSVIVPALRKYRCYDGNTRSAIAKDKGLVREGDLLSLDFHAELLAEKYAKEILDPGSEGKWKPGTIKRRGPRSGHYSEIA
jgi:hypothetical protein